MHISAANAILTKTRAKYGRRIKEENYRDMLTLTSISDVTVYLKTRTHYAKALRDVKESGIHRDNLELLLKRDMFDDLASLCRFERSVGEQFYKCMILRSESDEILEFLRLYQAGKPQAYLLGRLDFFDNHKNVDLNMLTKAKTYDELLDAVSDAETRGVLKNFRPQEGGVIEFTAIENALDKLIYKKIFALINRCFTGATKKELLRIFGMKAELENIKMIYRAKKYYNTPPDTIRSDLISAQMLLNKRKMDLLVMAETPERVLEILVKSGYRRLPEDRINKSTDNLASEFLGRELRKIMRFSSNPASVMAAGIFLSEIEIDNITNIIEGIRYSVNPEYIRALLVKTG